MVSPIKPSDPIIGPVRGTPTDVFNWYISQWGTVPDALYDYLAEVYNLAPQVGIDPAIVVAQAALETGNFGNIPGAGATAWLERRNPGSIGITSTGKPGEPDIDAGHSWKDGTDAARGQIVHLLAYLDETGTPEQIRKADEVVNAYYHLDPRYQRVFEADLDGFVRHLSDLGNGKWAADKDYAAKIAARGNQIFGFIEEQSMAITFGNVAHPGYLDRLISKPEGQGWDNLGQRQPKFVVLHRMIGSLPGTDSYFRMAGVNALTDYGVGVAVTDGADMAGVIYRWNDPRGVRAGWASGPVNGAYGDGLAIVNKYGLNAVNRDGVSIEISGNYDTALDATAFEEIAKLMAYWWDQMRIPWDKAPINPATGISGVLWHQEFTLGSGKVCPGQVVIDATPKLITRATAILKAAQEGITAPPKPAPTPKPAPKYPEGLDADLAARWFGKVMAEGQTFQFDPNGSVSRLWLAEGGKTGKYPALTSVETFGERIYYRFADSLTIWRPNAKAPVRVLKAA